MSEEEIHPSNPAKKSKIEEEVTSTNALEQLKLYTVVVGKYFN
jgi:hypothetical protein